mgnify:CR=1 FL=1|jgi:hypothetical protein
MWSNDVQVSQEILEDSFERMLQRIGGGFSYRGRIANEHLAPPVMSAQVALGLFASDWKGEAITAYSSASFRSGKAYVYAEIRFFDASFGCRGGELLASDSGSLLRTKSEKLELNLDLYGDGEIFVEENFDSEIRLRLFLTSLLNSFDKNVSDF